MHLSVNNISDVAPLAGLTKLTGLYIRDNNISDVSPLIKLNLTGTRWTSTGLDVRGNPLSSASINTHIPAMQARGIEVEFGDDAPTIAEEPVDAGPKIEGPWLWVIAPTRRAGASAAASGIDFLSLMSNGSLTETKIATEGATAGASVGDSVWTPHKLSPTVGDNINDMANAAGLGIGDIDNHVAYGSIALDSPRQQQTIMHAGSDDAVKVWLNGELVHNNPVDRPAYDFQDLFPVTLKAGTNILLVAVYEGWGAWSGFFGFAADAEYTLILPADSTVSFSPATLPSPAIGEQLTLSLKIANGENVAGYQATVQFDDTALRYVSSANGDYLPAGAFVVRPRLTGNTVTLGAVSLDSATDKRNGGLATITFEVIAAKPSTLTLSDVVLSNEAAEGSVPKIENAQITEPTGLKWDVNGDGITDGTDIILVGAALGQKNPQNPRLDVNGDGIVDAKDLVLVAEHLGEGDAPAGPSHPALPLGFILEDVEHVLNILRAADDGTLTFKRGIENLEQLLARFVPENTALLHNYPNPFNPETWIPYQLAEPTEVTLHIYAVNGALVRTLALGHQPAGVYRIRSRAAYWDGRNAFGEPVASGLYFYTLSAGDFTATRKMLIRK